MMQGGGYGDLGNPKEELAEQFEKKQLAKSKYVSEIKFHYQLQLYIAAQCSPHKIILIAIHFVGSLEERLQLVVTLY